MKKTLALIVMLAAVLLCSAALADAPIITSPMSQGAVEVDPFNDYQTIFEIDHNGSDYLWELVYYINDEMYSVVPDDDHWFESPSVVTGDSVIYWDYLAIGDATPLNGEVKHELYVYSLDENGDLLTQVVEFYVDWFGYEHPWGYGWVLSECYDLISLPCWYPDNTANSFGPKADGTWQTYSAIDLTVEGEQTFDLIAAGAWKIGIVKVTVNGDEVIVTYEMTEDLCTSDVWDDITVDSEYLNLFADVASIDLSAESTFAFGQPISIANDLGGDTSVAMVVSNKVDYPSHSPFVTRFWPNLPENKAIVEAMNALLAE